MGIWTVGSVTWTTGSCRANAKECIALWLLKLHLFQSLSQSLSHEQKLSKKTKVLFKLYWKLARRSMAKLQLLIEYSLRYFLTKKIFRNENKNNRSKRQGLVIWKVNTPLETHLQVNNCWSETTPCVTRSQTKEFRHNMYAASINVMNKSANLSCKLCADMFWLVLIYFLIIITDKSSYPCVSSRTFAEWANREVRT